jgi:DNA topoisomerase-2
LLGYHPLDSLHPSFNICDEEEKITGYRNCFGATIANIFSTYSVLEIASKEQGKRFKQEWRTNMTKDNIPEIRTYSGSSFTEITFSFDLGKFKVKIFKKFYSLKKNYIDVFGRWML